MPKPVKWPRKLVQYDPLYVEWEDAVHHGGRTAWNHPDDLGEPADEDMLMSHLGFMYALTDRALTLVSAVDGDRGQVSSVFQIPRGTITKIRKLKL